METDNPYEIIQSYITLTNSPDGSASGEITEPAITPIEEPGLERSILEPCQHPVYVEDPTDQPCSHFFQQSGSILYKTYLRLKREERLAIIRYHAAVTIQAFWRGFLIRSNMKILHIAAIKIQSLIRGCLSRQRFRYVAQASYSKRHAELREAAATKIQAAWRGFKSRQSKFNYVEYKSVQEKNAALKRSIERINELEAALLRTLDTHPQGSTESLTRSSSSRTSTHAPSQGGSIRRSSDQPRRSSSEKAKLIDLRRMSHTSSKKSRRVSVQSRATTSACGQYRKDSMSSSDSLLNLQTMSPSLENFIVDKLPDLVQTLSQTRIAELYAYLANMETEMKVERELEAIVRKVGFGGIHKLKPEQLQRLEASRQTQRERANLILELAKLIMMGPLKAKLLEKDSVDTIFPVVLERPDVPKADISKVHALKDAIRMLRQQVNAKQERELQKQHVLLRTQACPGVYSDIYTTELTEMEQKLKSVKYWKRSVMADNALKRDKASRDDQLKRLFKYALQISRKVPSAEREEFEEQEGASGESEEYDEFRGEDEYGPEDDDLPDPSEFFLLQSNPSPPPPTPSNGDDVYFPGLRPQTDELL